MTDYTTLSYRDASMYFNDCLAVDREASTAHRTIISHTYELGAHGLTSQIEEKHQQAEYVYIVYNTTTTRSAATIYTPKEFHDKFFVNKFPVGWVNCDSVAVYMQSPLSRSTSKGHRRDTFTVLCPYADALSAVYSSTISQVQELDDAKREYLNQLRNTYTKMLSLIRNDGSVVAQVKGSLYSPRFYTPEEVIDNFTVSAPRRVGMAMSREFGVSINRNFFGTSAGLYYHTKQIGAVFNDGFKLFEPFMQVKPQFERTFGQDIGVI